MNDDNYVNYDVLLYLADYLQINLVIIDIIDMEYSHIKYQLSDLSSFNSNNSKQEIGFDCYNLDHDTDQCLVIVKYEGDTYLPIMCKTGNHFISSGVVDILTEQGYTPIYNDKFKVRTSVTVTEQQPTPDNSTIVDIVSDDKENDMDSLNKVLDQVKARKIAREQEKKEKRQKNLKPKKKEVKEVKKVEKKVELPVEGDSSDEEPQKEELERVEPANILSEDWIKIYCPAPKKSLLAKVKLDLMQNTATFYGVDIYKDSNGKKIKLTKLELASQIYRVYVFRVSKKK